MEVETNNEVALRLAKIHNIDFGLYKEDAINEIVRLQNLVDELTVELKKLTKDQ
jgi:hypothetical protein